MTDRFPSLSHAAVITPSDTALITPIPLRLLINAGAGATGIKVDTLGGNVGVTIPLLASAVVSLDLQVTRVYATGTTLGTGGSVTALW